MLSKAKRNYVNSHHTGNIYQMRSKNKYRDGKWRTYVYEDGKRKGVECKTEEELYDSLYTFYKRQENIEKTLEDVFSQLMQRKRHELNRDPKTINDDSRYFGYLSASLKSMPISSITEADLRKWFVTQYMPRKPRESALRKMIGILNQTFNYAVRQRLCIENPARFIRFNDYVKDCNLVKKTNEQRSFSVEECMRLRNDALENRKNPRFLMRLLAIETGMRAGELAAIHKSDLSENYIHVHRQIVKDHHAKPETFHEVGYSKNERQRPRNGRYVPITPVIQSIIEMAKGLPGESEYLFHDKAGIFITPDSYEYHLRRACKRLSIDTHNNHAFRIAHNSKLIEIGLSSADRALLLGQSVETNERYYSVTDMRRLEGLRAKLQ